MLIYYKIQIAFFSLCTAWLPVLFSSLIKVLRVSEHNFFILNFHCFMLLLNFTTSKYSFLEGLLGMVHVFPVMSSSWQFPHKYFLYCSSSACSVYTEGSGINTFEVGCLHQHTIISLYRLDRNGKLLKFLRILITTVCFKDRK